MNKSFITGLFAAIALIAGFSACTDTTTGIGSSLIQEESQVIIHDEFAIQGHTVDNERIESRTITQLLGRIDADGYGQFSSDFVCQFMPASKLATEDITVNDIDSMKLFLAYMNGSFVGDSIMPMGLEVFLLNKQLPTPIYSTFDPTEYCDVNSAPLASGIYVGNAMGENDSIRALNYREITIDLPLKLGRDLFQLYLDNPEAYAYPKNFAKYFPGIYVRNTFGEGRVTQIQRTLMVIYYHTITTDSEGKQKVNRFEGNYFAVTPEVISNSNIDFSIDPKLQADIDAGEKIIVAPVGRDIEITFPLADVIDYYNTNRGTLSVVNSLTMKIPAERIANAYGIEPPQNVLLILSSKKDDFFLNNELTDDKTSFIATYSSADKCYNFSSMRQYFLDMYEKYNGTTRAEVDPKDITFTITPVELTTETIGSSYYSSGTTYISSVTPYIGRPAMTRLSLDKADVIFQFSKQTLK